MSVDVIARGLAAGFTGDVVGPAVSVNGQWAIFSGTSGKLLAVAPFTPEDASKKGVANGYAPLDASALLDAAYLPSIAITDTFVVASQVAMLALSAEKGDVAVRTDLNKSYILATNSPTTLADWKELLTPTDAVLSVVGLTGAISAAALAATQVFEAFGEYNAINRQTASYGLVLADKGKLVEMNVAGANDLTVPLNSTQAFPVKSRIDIAQYGAGQTTVVATGGVTIRSSGGKLKLNGQYAAASLIKIATDEWYLVGNIAT
jgi:hypothetical protein